MDKESNERGRVGEGGNMTGRALQWKSFFWRRILFWGEEAFWRGTRVLISWLGFSGSMVRVLQSLSIIAGGTGLLGVLGTGARISIWYPGARKLS